MDPALALATFAGNALPFLSLVLDQLPLATRDLAFSFVRMVLAYALSLGFSLAYGYLSAYQRSGERVLIPVLDILQSVPILGFFPVAIVFFITVLPPPFGINLAVVFLIFTSMSWNMAFGVYESLRAIPEELRQAADSFAVRGRQRLVQVLFPATANRLVYNSVLSWTAGWYYLVASEIITSGRQVAGIGSYLARAAQTADGSALTAGLAVLVALIAALDVFVWRPLGRWAERFRYDQVPTSTSELQGVGLLRRSRVPLRRAVGFVARGVRSGVTVIGAPIVTLGQTLGVSPRRTLSRPRARSGLRLAGVGALLVVVWLLLITLVVAVFRVYTSPIPLGELESMRRIPLALAESLGRVIGAYSISLAVALPLAIALARHPKASRLGLPAVEVVASIPATAFFPVFVFVLLGFVGLEGAAILLLVTGMIWYLFFNILSGLRAIPPDLGEAAQAFGLRRRAYYRRLVLPAILPAFITGSITAFGGGWNTLVLAEYFPGSPPHPSLAVVGVGAFLDESFALGQWAWFVATLLTLVLTVVVLNELIWKPLYRRVVGRYRYD